MRIRVRGRGRGRALAIIAVVAGLAGPVLAEQNESCPGDISSASLQPLVANATYDVENYGNPDNPLALRTKFLKWLTRAGYRTASPPTYMFSFKADVAQPARTPAPGRQAEEDSLSSTLGGNFAGGTYSTMDSSGWLYGLESLPRRRSAGSGAEVRLHVNVQLRNQQGGRVVWFADVICSLQTDDRAQLIEAISKPLIAQLGRTSRQVPF
jgi:hypothetical protein